MAKPPPSGPHSDISGVNRDARVNSPTRDPQGNDASDLDEADEQSKGQPDEDSVPSRGS
ncbi:hypothetical protein [Sphingomonas solaris]|uniref:hypothetical protein n=1 Tax=Alterirhizorhabdus solaris TaxID=2529389 RepID=UPI001396CE24|nr:hypothetical protein [Sphingomonas solaris]